MATIREWYCEGSCRPEKAGQLFDALLSIAEGKGHDCPVHRIPCKLRLTFAFGLDAKDSVCTVLGTFRPRKPESWLDLNRKRIYFFPFLVVLRRHGRKQAVWLPYWHRVGSKNARMKYGQWAPFMDEHLFCELLAQARRKGFFVDGATKVV